MLAYTSTKLNAKLTAYFVKDVFSFTFLQNCSIKKGKNKLKAPEKLVLRELDNLLHFDIFYSSVLAAGVVIYLSVL